MAEVIVGLRDSGRRAATKEVEALTGLAPALTFATVEEQALLRLLGDPSLKPLADHLGVQLQSIGVRVDKELGRTMASITAGGKYAREGLPASAVIAARVEARVPGAMAAAADLVSGPFASGLADVFNETAELFDGCNTAP